MNIFHKIDSGGNNQDGVARQIQFASGNQNSIQIRLNRGKDVKKSGSEPRMIDEDSI